MSSRTLVRVVEENELRRLTPSRGSCCKTVQRFRLRQLVPLVVGSVWRSRHCVCTYFSSEQLKQEIVLRHTYLKLGANVTLRSTDAVLFAGHSRQHCASCIALSAHLGTPRHLFFSFPSFHFLPPLQRTVIILVCPDYFPMCCLVQKIGSCDQCVLKCCCDAGPPLLSLSLSLSLAVNVPSWLLFSSKGIRHG